MESITSFIKKPLRRFSAYQWIAQKYRKFQKLCIYFNEAKRLSAHAASAVSINEILEIKATSPIFTSSQKISEITSLLTMLEEKKPLNIMELGTQKGGTLFLFSQVCSNKAEIITVDLKYPSEEYRKTIPYFVKHGQRIYAIEGDSHEDKTFRKVKSKLKGEKLDFLFIDGDHTYEGVKKDFEMYSKLVRSGGIIALHDIVPDSYTRFGIRTNSFTGGVPAYWRELKNHFPKSKVLIDEVGQDGFGIGVINFP